MEKPILTEAGEKLLQESMAAVSGQSIKPKDRPGDQPVGALQQPAPEDADGPVIHDLLITDLRQGQFRFSGMRSYVEEDVRDRLEFGLRKYGKPLRAHNGRNALLDAYQEGLDQLVYFIQAMLECQVQSPADARRLARLASWYDSALALVFELREELANYGG